MSDRNDSHVGLVVLVGAGPGDPLLISRAGEEWIRRADSLLYDRLAPPQLLNLAPPGCRLIDVGKSPGDHRRTQEQIHELLIEEARAGRLVVRLKGGDPLIFGRGGEEASALRAADIPFRIVPGITAAIAAGAFAGIPLTDRRVGPALALVTGHEDPDKGASQVDYAALARIDTVVFYMGVGRLEQIAAALMSAGRDAATPAAVVERASQPDQRVVTAPLGEIAQAVAAAGVTPPALLIVGGVVALREQAEWLSRLPLAGRTVLVTRSRTQASRLAADLRIWGAEVIEAPTVAIEPVEQTVAVDTALRDLAHLDWLVLTSPNGVAALRQRLGDLKLDSRALGSVRVAAVGPGTAEALEGMGITPDLMPSTFTTAALGEALAAAGVAGRRVLLLRSDLATQELPARLTAAGAQVRDLAVYRTVRPEGLPDEALDRLARRQVDWITFTSSSTVDNFLTLADGVDLSGVRLASIGPVTSATLRAHGLEPTAEAAPHDIPGLVRAILEAERERRDQVR